MKSVSHVLADAAVHLGDLELVLEIRDGPQPSDDHIGLPGGYIIYQKSGKGVNRDPFLVPDDLTDHVNPLIKAEQGIFLGVAGNRHDDLVKDFQTAIDECPGVRR